MFVDYIGLGARIRSYRKQMHYTQEQLAESVGISLSFLGHIERGSRKASLDTLIALCNVLNVSPHVLLQDSLNDSVRGIPQQGDERQQNMLREVSEILIKYNSEN